MAQPRHPVTYEPSGRHLSVGPTEAPDAPSGFADISPHRRKSVPDWALRPGCAGELVAAAVPEVVTGLWSVREVTVSDVRRHSGTWVGRALMRFTDHTTATTRTVPIVLKHDAGRDGRHADRASRVLRAAGLDGPAYAVVRTLGVTRGGTLVAEAASGRPWTRTLTGTNAAAGAEAVAHFLLAAQSRRAELTAVNGEWKRASAELDDLVVFAAEHLPGALAQLERFAERLRRLADSPPQATVPSHGDLHPANVFLREFADRTAAQPLGRTPGRLPAVTVIDLDHTGLREPAADLGYALCQILVTGRRRGVATSQSARTAHQLWHAYRAGGGRATADRVAAWAARSFVQVMHFEVIGFGGGRAGSLRSWTELALRLLDRGPNSLVALATGTEAKR